MKRASLTFIRLSQCQKSCYVELAPIQGELQAQATAILNGSCHLSSELNRPTISLLCGAVLYSQV